MAVQSVGRAIAILHEFTPDAPLLGVADISRQLDLDRSAVQRTVATLVDGGLLEQDPVSGKYRLGLGLLELSGTMLQGRNLPGAIRPFLRELTDLVGESVYLGMLYRGNSVLQIDEVTSAHLIGYTSWIGRRMPLYCTASGRVLMAHMKPERLEVLLDAMELLPRTAKTVTDREELTKELAVVRDQGFSITLEEFMEGVNAASVAVAAPKGGMPLTVAVAGPTYRFSEERVRGCTDALLAVANQISSRLPNTMFNQ